VTVVVGYDGHERSDAALDRAIEEARDQHEKLVVLAVFEVPLDPAGLQNYGTYDDSPPPAFPTGEPAELESVLTRARARVEAEVAKADYLWVAGDPATAIAETAREHHARLVVLGAHEHSWLGRLVGTDVADGVRREFDGDVVTV